MKTEMKTVKIPVILHNTIVRVLEKNKGEINPSLPTDISQFVAEAIYTKLLDEGATKNDS